MKKIKEFCLSHKKEIIIIIYLIALSLFLTSFIRKENDYFWHIKVGEYMFNNGLLTHDIFSWSVYDKYWTSHEWLFELFIYSLKLIFGNLHFIIYPFITLLLFFIIAYYANKKQIKNNLLFTIFWFSLSFIFSSFIQIRPHLISFVLLALSVYILYNLYNNENSKKIYFLPFITVLWANFHGGSSNLGYLLCFCFLIIGLFNFNFEKIEAKRLSKKQIIKYLTMGIISVFCTCINIHGVKMLYYPYINMLDTTMLENITEWFPTSVSNIEHYPFFIVAICTLFVFLFSSKKIRFIDFALFGLGIFLGLKSIRFWPYIYIISTFYIFYYSNKSDNDIDFINKAFIICSIAYFCIFCITINSNFNIIINKSNVSEKIVDIIKEENPKKLFNYYDIGGELVYNNISVFIDGRADLYSENGVFKDYLTINKLERGYEYLINKYNFDYFLIYNFDNIYTYLNQSDLYEIIYYDSSNNISLYKKKESTQE